MSVFTFRTRLLHGGLLMCGLSLAGPSMAAAPAGLELECKTALTLATRAFNRAADAQNKNDRSGAIAYKAGFWDIYDFSQHCAGIQQLADELTGAGLSKDVVYHPRSPIPGMSDVVIGGGGGPAPIPVRTTVAPLGPLSVIKTAVTGMVAPVAPSGQK